MINYKEVNRMIDDVWKTRENKDISRTNDEVNIQSRSWFINTYGDKDGNEAADYYFSHVLRSDE